ncbi:MAG: rRNA maturation RNase YbeY [Deltaproteobacteria bacterium]|nr:MAG: rRNA maturation RNase YbeY [Deltaproteobacteria bacterium]
MIDLLDQQTVNPDLAEALLPRAEQVMDALELGEAEVSLVLCDDPAIQELNRDWRGFDKPTDVLSFPQDGEVFGSEDGSSPVGETDAVELPPVVLTESSEGSEMEPPPIVWPDDDVEGELPDVLGDVVISVETCQRQAEECGHSLLDEATRLWIHGLLHLCGYDHHTEEEAQEMREKEEDLLALFGERGTVAPLVQL